MAKALDGVKALDFTRVYAGPFCTKLLGDLGAEVIKVEIPGGGDSTRTIPPLIKEVEGEGYLFVLLNHGKKSTTLNLRSERGRDICRELTKRADVVVENFAPGVMDNLGLGYEELSKIKPLLIYASVSGFGQTGPRRSQTAYDMVAQAMGGMMSVTGFPDGPPVKAGPCVADFVGGLYATISILAALHHRSKTGEGQMIDISLQDAVWSITAVDFGPNYFLTGEIPQRLGNGLPLVTPYNVYPARDGWVVIVITTVGHWETFLRVIGREDLLGVQKYATMPQRINHRHEVDALVEEWTKTRSVQEIVDELGGAHLPCSPVPEFDEVANDPQLLSREMITEVEQTLTGKVKVLGSVFKLSKTPGEVKSPAPFLGEHNYEVYSNILGYSEQEIKKLQSDGII